jgi:ornithine cyclodeaminase/alanine dehydrogenase-like protein (mu-crystallin family)
MLILNKKDLETLLAMEDVVVAHRAYEKAIQEGKGQQIEIF